MVLLLALSLAACQRETPAPAPQETAPAPQATPVPAAGLTPGTYQGTATGRNGMVVVDVTFDENGITAISVAEHEESSIISDPAFERVPANIMEYQSLQMDTVTGATITQYAIISAVADCVAEAGGDPAEWRQRAGQHKQAGADVEKTADVIVVGGGGAGLAAAVSAIDEGAKVILIEKTAALGGNTMLSGGVLNAAEPEWQKGHPADAGEAETLQMFMDMDANAFPEEYRATFKTLQGQLKEYLATDRSYLFDSPELHIINTYYYGARKGLDGTEIYGIFDLVQSMCLNALDTVNWLSEKGISWQPTVSQPVGAMWRRGHTPADYPKGQEYAVKLGRLILDSGNEYMLETAAKSLIIEDGKVIGVNATQADGTKVTLKAGKGVVLATGGFGSNTKMVQEYDNYWGDIPDNAKTTNASGSTGDGIAMGLEAGAGLVGMGYAQMMPTSDLKTGDLFTGLIPRFAANYIFINNEGRRFVDEVSPRDTLAIEAFKQPDGMFYMIADADIAEEAKWLTDPEVEVKNGRVHRADTLEELARLIDIDPAVLVEEMEKYNSYVDGAKDEDTGKTNFNLKVDTAPYYATPRAPAIHHTMGGLNIDTGTHVLSESGEIIPGLYAAGEVTGGFHAGNRLGGNAIADIFVNGKIAGGNAAKGA
ncbi:MAG: FAD-dependent oxidoreductase [Clostridiales bacterium]|nr:FAD-dependent oxidoreductase [Clostridiales bacterium]